MAEKLTKGQRFYRELFPLDPVTGKPNVPLEKKLSNRVVPAPLPQLPIPIQPDLPITRLDVPIAKDAQGRPFVLKDTSSLPQRVRKLKVDLSKIDELEIEPPKAPRGSLLPRELTPLSLQPIIEPRVRDVTLPALEDWLQLTPESERTARERKERAQRRAIELRDSAIPQWRRTLGQIHSWLDNIEDGLTTALVIARPFARRFPRLLGPLSYLAGTAEIVDNVAAISAFPSLKSARALLIKKALGRNPFLIQYRLRGKGLSRFQQLPTVDKFKLANLPNLERITRQNPTIGEMLEVAQTAHDLFGVGLLLGPLYGTLDEIAASAIAREPVRIRFGQQGPLVSDAINNMRRAIPLLQPGAPISDKDYLLTLGSVRVNTKILLDDVLQTRPTLAPASKVLPKIKPPGGTHPETFEVWEEFGEPIIEEDFTWPGTFESEADPLELGPFLAEGALDESRRRILESDDPVFRDLASDLIVDTVEDFLQLGTEGQANIARDLDTIPTSVVTLAEAGLFIDDSECSEEQLMRALGKLAQVEAFTVRSSLPVEAIVDILRRDGCKVGRMADPID